MHTTQDTPPDTLLALPAPAAAPAVAAEPDLVDRIFDYILADPAVNDALRLVRLPYHLSALTQAAAVAALRHADVMLSMVDDIRSQRDRLLQELPSLGYTVHASHANFVLFGGIDNPQQLFTALLERGILVRDVGITNHLRVTAGTKAETTAFLDALATLKA
jgi:histidinol-phosphate aminotransferase